MARSNARKFRPNANKECGSNSAYKENKEEKSHTHAQIQQLVLYSDEIVRTNYRDGKENMQRITLASVPKAKARSASAKHQTGLQIRESEEQR